MNALEDSPCQDGDVLFTDDLKTDWTFETSSNILESDNNLTHSVSTRKPCSLQRERKNIVSFRIKSEAFCHGTFPLAVDLETMDFVDINQSWMHTSLSGSIQQPVQLDVFGSHLWLGIRAANLA